MALDDDRFWFSVSDCLLRWYDELLSPKESLKEICLGVTGEGLKGVRLDGARLEPSAVVVNGGRFSRPAERYAKSLVVCWLCWLSVACRARALSRWSERRRETCGGDGTSWAGIAVERGRRWEVRMIRDCKVLASGSVLQPSAKELTIGLGSATAGCFSVRGAGSSRAIFIKMSAVLSLSVVVVISPDSDGGCVKSSSRRPSRARNARSRWLVPVVSPLYESSDVRRLCISNTPLLRDPDDRKDLMGGITARPLEVLAAPPVLVVWLCLRDMGGRDLLSSDLVPSTALGTRNSRWRGVGSFAALSVRRRLSGVVATDDNCDRADTSSEAGRFDPGDESADEVVLEGRWNLSERVLVAPPLCLVSSETGRSGKLL